MNTANSDRNLLYGILALHLDLISRESLIQAMKAWVRQKDSTLGDVLQERQAITTDEHALLEAIVTKHLDRHENDPVRSLQAVSSIQSVRADLERIDDQDLQARLQQVSIAHSIQPPATLDFAIRTASSSSSAASSALRYHVLRPHARGGLGEIFIARDTELNREVALKEIQPHCAQHSESRLRFLMEAQITGCLEHPGIVPVYGLGQYGDGRPYYAMRFVRGDSLEQAVTKFHHSWKSDGSSKHRSASRNSHSAFTSLEFRQLLGRFVDVCNAMSYAHTRGVLHRDLKPGNIMLGKYGETLVVDWGLAKLHSDTSSQNEGSELFIPSAVVGNTPTQMGAVVGTPAYMSPEQASGRFDQLGPATDVYSLGATLYQILTGHAPFERQEAGILLQRVQAADYKKPREINAKIPRALEALCLKAMAVRPADRYESPTLLAEDVEKWLADEPVSAYVDPLTVRVRRWGRRHRALVISTAAVMLASLISLAVVLILITKHSNELTEKNVELYRTNGQLAVTNTSLRKSRQQERAASKTAEAKRIEAELARTKEAQSRQQAETVSEYLVQAFRSPDPERDGQTITVVEVLDRATDEIERQFADDLRTKARLIEAIGQSYVGLGVPQKAVPLFESMRTLLTSSFGTADPDTMGAMHDLAAAYQSVGRIDEAIPLHEEALRLMESTLGEEHSDTLNANISLAAAYRWAGRNDEALPLLEKTILLIRSELGSEHPLLISAMQHLGDMYRASGRVNEALPLLEETLALSKSHLGDKDPTTLSLTSNLAAAHRVAGHYEQAQRLYIEALGVQKATLGADHPATLITMSRLADAYRVAGQLDEALPLSEEVLPLMKVKFGPDHPVTLSGMNNLADMYHAVGRVNDALPLFEETLRLMKTKLGPEHSETIIVMGNLAATYTSARRFAEAVPLAEETAQLMKSQLGEAHPHALTSMNNLASVYESAGRPEDALPVYEEALRLRKAHMGAGHPETLTTMQNLGRLFFSIGRVDDSLQMLEEALQLSRATLGETNPQTIQLMDSLALRYLRANLPDKALPLFAEFITRLREQDGPISSRFVNRTSSVSYDLLQHQQFRTAETYLRECLAIAEEYYSDRAHSRCAE